MSPELKNAMVKSYAKSALRAKLDYVKAIRKLEDALEFEGLDEVDECIDIFADGREMDVFDHIDDNCIDFLMIELKKLVD